MPRCVRSSDESVGAIEISWIGHGAHDWVANAALVAMWSYLANGDSSPAAKTFVNIPEAYCSGICVNSDSRDPCIVTVLLSNVPVKHLDTLARRFSSFIEDQSHCPLDMKRMSYQLKQQRLSLLGTLETDSSSYVQGSILQEILYGAEDGSQLADVFDDLEIIKKLQTFTENDWLNILDECVGSSSPPSPPCSRLTLGTLACRWILERHAVTVIAHPSTKLAHDQAAGTKAVVAANRARLGTAGLARAAADLEHAKKVNEHPAPRKLVESYKVPSLDSVGWLKVETARSNGVARGRETFSGRLQSHINADAGDVPYFIQFDHFPSSFVEVAVLLHGPPTELFPLFVDTFFAMPIMREDGTRLSFDQVNRALDELAIGFGAQTLGEGVLVSIQVVKEDYEAAIVWLSDIVYGTQFDDIERCVRLPLYSLHKCPAELTLTSLPAASRPSSTRLCRTCRARRTTRWASPPQGSRICSFRSAGASEPLEVRARTAADLLKLPRSVSHVLNLVNRAKLYPQLAARLKKDPEGVVKDLKALQKQFLDARAIRIKVAGDILSLKTPSSSWLTHFEHVLPFPVRAPPLVLVVVLRSRYSRTAARPTRLPPARARPPHRPRQEPVSQGAPTSSRLVTRTSPC